MAPSGPIIWAEGEGKIVADVIFIHGLRGDAVKTWSKGDICWPRDLLKHDLKNARIISWGYDSSVLKPIKSSSQASIFGHVENLLNDISRIRDSLKAEIRPIIFVGHSLGGLLIKEALIRASEYLSNLQHVDLGAIYSCTKGVVFLGTPHRGSGKAGIAEVISNIAKIGLQNPNDKLIEVLSEDSQILERQMKSFTTISSTVPIACITEEIATGIGMIVPTASATLQGHLVRTSSVPANHMDMCRFTKPEDVGYQRVSQHIINFVRQAVKNGERKFIEDVLAGLAYMEMDDRENQIEDAYARTFKWLLPTEDQHKNEQLGNEFLDWIKSEKSPLYWISGKAGSGKSTLMKSLYGNPVFRTLLEEWAKPASVTFAGFFFFDRGKSMLQKSRIGLLRSLLRQILGKHRELVPDLFSSRFKIWSLNDPRQPRYRFDWTWEELSAAFEAILQQSDSFMKFCIFADGLDEYSIDIEPEYGVDEEEDLATERSERRTAGHVEIAKLFLRVAASPNVKLCLSSRPLLRFESAFKDFPHLKLQDLTETDISIYVNGRLAQDSRMVELTSRDPLNGNNLITTIVNRASGVFLWVRLVVDRLLEGLEDHDTLAELQRTIDSLPRELGGRKGLYMRMLEDMKPAFRIQAAKFFRVVQTTCSPLSLLSLSFSEVESPAIIAKTQVEQISPSEAEFQSKWMEGRLKSRCAGLLESQPLPASRGKTLAKMPTKRVKSSLTLHPYVEPQLMVQFLHQTAKEFLEQEFVWDIVFNHPETMEFDPNMALLKVSVMRLKKIGLDGSDSYSKLTRAWEVILDALYYATRIEREPGDLQELEFLLDDLDSTATVLLQEMNNIGVKSPKFSGLHWMMTEPTQSDFARDPLHGKNWDTFTSLAIECNLTSYVRAKLDSGSTKISDKKGRPLLAYAIIPRTETNSRVRKSDNRYSFIGEKASPILVETLLRHGADPNGLDVDSVSIWQTALKPRYPWKDATQSGNILKLLIAYGADPFLGIEEEGRNRSPLFIISRDHGANPAMQTELIIALKSKGGMFFEGESEELTQQKSSLHSPEKDSDLDSFSRNDYLPRKRENASGNFVDFLQPPRWGTALLSSEPYFSSDTGYYGYDRRFDWGSEFGLLNYPIENYSPAMDEESDGVLAEIKYHLKRVEVLEKLRPKGASSDQEGG